MNFENLPADWPTIPLTDPDHIADVLDLFVSRRDRMGGALLILICDAERRPVQPVVINDIDAGPPGGAHLPLEAIAQQMAALEPDATVLCAIARTGRARVTKSDRRWAQTLEAAFAGHLQLLGVHVITLDGATPVTVEVEDAA